MLDVSKKYQPIADFYAGKSIFVTGATGYIGKVFLEKLLYTCNDIDKIYILTRDKKGVSAADRVRALTENQVFGRLKYDRPQDLKKIIPITGDILENNLGIKPEEEHAFLEKISVVFHIAATTKFNEDLDVALNTNLEGTRRVLSLCQRMKNLKALVHFSTAYCHTNLKVLEETIYPPPATMGEVKRFLDQHRVDDQENLRKLLKNRPNTYTFTKALAETCVAENHVGIPTVIIRPSIVSPALAEPFEGWVDNWGGATGLLTAVAKGYIRFLLGDANNVLDLIPVDYVSNLAIAAAAAASCNSPDIHVYNSCTSSCNPLTFKNTMKYIKEYSSETDFEDTPFPFMIFMRNERAIVLMSFLTQKVPAFVADSWRFVKGKKPRYLKLNSEVESAKDTVKYFTARSWAMKADRVRDLSSSLCPRDRNLFPCDPALIPWGKYINIYFHGVQRLLLRK